MWFNPVKKRKGYTFDRTGHLFQVQKQWRMLAATPEGQRQARPRIHMPRKKTRFLDGSLDVLKNTEPVKQNAGTTTNWFPDLKIFDGESRPDAYFVQSVGPRKMNGQQEDQNFNCIMRVHRCYRNTKAYILEHTFRIALRNIQLTFPLVPATCIIFICFTGSSNSKT